MIDPLSICTIYIYIIYYIYIINIYIYMYIIYIYNIYIYIHHIYNITYIIYVLHLIYIPLSSLNSLVYSFSQWTCHFGSHFTPSSHGRFRKSGARFDILLYLAQFQEILKWDDIFSVRRVSLSCEGCCSAMRSQCSPTVVFMKTARMIPSGKLT